MVIQEPNLGAPLRWGDQEGGTEEEDKNRKSPPLSDTTLICEASERFEVSIHKWSSEHILITRVIKYLRCMEMETVPRQDIQGCEYLQSELRW